MAPSLTVLIQISYFICSESIKGRSVFLNSFYSLFLLSLFYYFFVLFIALFTVFFFLYSSYFLIFFFFPSSIPPSFPVSLPSLFSPLFPFFSTSFLPLFFPYSHLSSFVPSFLLPFLLSVSYFSALYSKGDTGSQVIRLTKLICAYSLLDLFLCYFLFD